VFRVLTVLLAVSLSPDKCMHGYVGMCQCVTNLCAKCTGKAGQVMMTVGKVACLVPSRNSAPSRMVCLPARVPCCVWHTLLFPLASSLPKLPKSICVQRDKAIQ